MTPTFRLPIALSLLLLAGCHTPAPRAGAHAAPPVRVGGLYPLELLKEGNARFAVSDRTQAKPTRERRAEIAQHQHPFAVVVGCADSRTSPEIVFDQGLGDLFVIRTAGNLVDDHALGSLEYAVEHLGVRLVVVLGHERCGAVSAALAGGEAPGHIGSLVRDIEPVLEEARRQSGDPVQNAVCLNASRVAKRIHEEAHLEGLDSPVRVVAACYDLDTGVVTWLP